MRPICAVSSLVLLLLGGCAVRSTEDHLAAGCEAGDRPSCVALAERTGATAVPGPVADAGAPPATPPQRSAPQVYPSVGVGIGSGGNTRVGVGVGIGGGNWWDDPYRRRW